MANYGSIFRLGLAASLCLLSACAATQTLPPAQTGDEARVPSSAKKPPPPDNVPPDSPTEISKIISETNHEMAEQGGENDKAPLQIPVAINRRVEQWIKYFTEREHDMTTRYLERGEPLRPYIQAILKENEVPPDLYYLAMIESGFRVQAKSRAKAVGIWQFVKGTGRNYKMTINSSVDERRNWIKATESAANYLKDLHNVFGSWYLALAAYNTGEYKIVRSIMKGKTRDFWALAESGFLPQETMDYVPKFLAAEIVAKNYQRLGFKLEMTEDNQWDDWEPVTVPSGVKLSVLAKTTNVPLEVLQRWNRDLLKGVTPFSSTGTVDIFMPKTAAAMFDAAKDDIEKLHGHFTKQERKRLARAEKGESEGYDFYVVRRGDNLSTISKHIGVSTRTLMKINGLRRGRIHPGQRLKFYASPTTAEAAAAEKDREPSSKKDEIPAGE